MPACYTGVDSPDALDQCAADTGAVEPEGEWDTDFEDWRDPGQPGNEFVEDACGVEGIIAHHCHSTAVHAVHLHTGDLMVFHGESDQRIWPIGAPPTAMTWHPVPFADEQPAADAGVVDLFCAGHSQLADGRVLFGGGNINGSPDGGGIRDTFRFEPFEAQAAVTGAQCPFGWDFEVQPGGWVNRSGRMTYDRWYPTLTTLADGRVLIAGGTSRRQAEGSLCDEDSDCVGDEICNLDTSTCQILGDPCAIEPPPCDGDLRCYDVTSTCQPAAATATVTRVLEVYDPSLPAESAITELGAEFPVPAGVPEYPFMFLLPNGDVLYAGAEAIDVPAQADGQVLVLDYSDLQASYWGHAITSTIGGGSAVMPVPGRVLKAGGADTGSIASESQTDAAEVVDLRGFASGEYDLAPTEFSLAAPMNYPRHYHNLTVLPDGRVLATGGNEYGNGVAGQHPNYPCEVDGVEVASRSCASGCPSVCINYAPEVRNNGSCVVPDPDYGCSLLREIPCDTDAECDAIVGGAVCHDDLGVCDRPCTELEADPENPLVCGEIADCGPGAMFESSRQTDMCDPRNNACDATKAAEIWDPSCNTWTELPEERFERMYHSTAILLPDGRVISMGNGHRGALREGIEPQYFAPQYDPDPNAIAPDVALYEFGLTNENEPAPDPVQNYLAWNGGEIDVIVENDVPIDGASLVRLGSNTHGFDMDQRWVPLLTSGQASPYRVRGNFANATNPFNENTAPPGWYMLFLLSDGGEPSHGQYIRVGPDSDQEYVCEASELLAIQEHSCSAEPTSAACPSGYEVTTELDLPTVPLGAGSVAGFRVIVPAGMVESHGDPTTDELAAIEGLCARACEDSIAGLPEVTANCDDAQVFAAVTPDGSGNRAVDLVRANHRHGEDLFPEEQLTCDLVTECHSAFDEVLDDVGARRVTPAQDTVGAGEEWLLTIEGQMEAISSHSQGQASAAISGTIGYSLCPAGNEFGPCPFYLGSLELTLDDPLTLVLECDGQPETHTMSSLSLELAQPAFGAAQADSPWRAFPPGALVFDASGVVDGVPFTSRRPTQEPLYMRATDGWSMVQGIDGAWVHFGVPCGEDVADVWVWWGYSSVAIAGHPPFASIGVPSEVECPSEVTLAASISDTDDDLALKQWLVDGVLLEHDMTTLDFTQAHELTLVVRDERGATVTDVKTVGCE